MNIAASTFAMGGAALVLVSFLIPNGIRRAMVLALAATLFGFGVLRLLTARLPPAVDAALSALYVLAALGVTLWLSRRLLAAARRKDPKLYAEWTRGASGLFWTGCGIVLVSLLGFRLFHVEVLRGAWIGGVLLAGLYLWERIGIRSLDRRTEVPSSPETPR